MVSYVGMRVIIIQGLQRLARSEHNYHIADRSALKHRSINLVNSSRGASFPCGIYAPPSPLLLLLLLPQQQRQQLGHRSPRQLTPELWNTTKIDGIGGNFPRPIGSLMSPDIALNPTVGGVKICKQIGRLLYSPRQSKDSTFTCDLVLSSWAVYTRPRCHREDIRDSDWQLNGDSSSTISDRCRSFCGDTWCSLCELFELKRRAARRPRDLDRGNGWNVQMERNELIRDPRRIKQCPTDTRTYHRGASPASDQFRSDDGLDFGPTLTVGLTPYRTVRLVVKVERFRLRWADRPCSDCSSGAFLWTSRSSPRGTRCGDTMSMNRSTVLYAAVGRSVCAMGDRWTAIRHRLNRSQ